jgi:hypothetical protein
MGLVRAAIAIPVLVDLCSEDRAEYRRPARAFAAQDQGAAATGEQRKTDRKKDQDDDDIHPPHVQGGLHKVSGIVHRRAALRLQQAPRRT